MVKMDTKSVPLENKNKIEMTESETQSLVAVCLGTGGIAAGGDKVFKKFEEEIKNAVGAVELKPGKEYEVSKIS